MMELVSCKATQLWVNREYNRWLRTQPWGGPVLSVSMEEVLLEMDGSRRDSFVMFHRVHLIGRVIFSLCESERERERERVIPLLEFQCYDWGESGDGVRRWSGVGDGGGERLAALPSLLPPHCLQL